jgi:predicted RND superfamily exporter protein
MRPAELLDALGRAQHRRRFGALAALVALTVALLGLAGARALREGAPVDFTPQAIFLDAGPELDALRRIEATFGREDNDVLVLVSGDLGSAGALGWLRGRAEALRALPGVERVDSPFEAGVLRGTPDGGLELLRPLDALPPAEGLAVLGADLLWGRLLVSPDGRTAALRVRVAPHAERVADLEPVLAGVAAAATAGGAPPGVEVQLTGVPWVRVEVVQRMLADQARFVPLVGLCFAAATTLLFRRLWLGLVPLVAVLLADAWTVAALVIGGVTFNVLSVLVPTLVIIIGIADGVHLTARYREELAADADPEAALGRTVREMALPCFLTTFTTAAGFGSLAVAETRVLRDFGVHSAVAMLVCYVAVMGVVPVLLALVPPDRVAARPAAGGEPPELRALSAIDRMVARRPGWALAGSAALSLLALGLGAGVRGNSHLLEMYAPGSPTWRAIHAAQDELSGVIPIFAHVDLGAPGAVTTADALRRVDAVEAALRAEGMVLWTRSPASALRGLHAALGGEGPLPATDEAAAQELMVAELSGDDPLAGVADPTRQQARVLALVADAGGRETLAMRDRVGAAAAAAFEGTGARVTLTGDGLLAAAGVDRLITDLLEGLALVFAIILGTLGLLLRDLRLALLACVPNLAPLAFTLGALGLMGADLQTSNIVSFTVAVGLAVDDTIHFLIRYRQERDRGYGPAPAVRRTFLGAGHAILTTTLLLVVGFSVLIASDLTSTRHFGLLSTVTLVAALLADLVLLPALLHLTERPGPRSPGP